MELNLPLERQLVAILRDNREDSYATQRKRTAHLMKVAATLHHEFGLQKWANLKAKHVALVIDAWKAEDTGRRSIDEKLSHLRWLVRKVGKANLVPRRNEDLGIAPGPRHSRAGKTISDALFAELLGRIGEERMRIASRLARYVGLRFKESMLFRPWRDFDGERVWVKRGTKGGHPRYLFVYNDRQREVLALARSLVRGDEGLIPREYPTYEKWRQRAYRLLQAAGIGRANDVLFHDARSYAERRIMPSASRERRLQPAQARYSA